MNTRYKIDIAVITADQWKAAFGAARKHFKLSEQRKYTKAFSEGKDVSVNLLTGFEKFVILQCPPIVADIVHSKPRCLLFLSTRLYDQTQK